MDLSIAMLNYQRVSFSRHRLFSPLESPLVEFVELTPKRSQALLQKNDTFLSEERPLELGITSYQLPLETETTLLVIFAYG